MPSKLASHENTNVASHERCFFALGYDENSPPKFEGVEELFKEFTSIFCLNSLFLLSKKIANEMNVKRHQELSGFSELNVALVDIELRENKLYPFLSEKYTHPKSLRDAVVVAFLGLSEIYKRLMKEDGERDWIIWSSMQPKIGDYEAELNDLKFINLAEVLQEKKSWWYDVDFSFAKYRPEVDDFLRGLILDDGWDETLSPFHFLFVPDHFRF